MKCKYCDHEVKDGRFADRNLKLHETAKHRSMTIPPTALEKLTEAVPPIVPAIKNSEAPAVEENPEVIFYCANLPFQTVIIQPTEWKLVQAGPAGEKWMPIEGVMVEFDNGILRSRDPLVIAYLEGDRAKTKALGVTGKNGEGRIYDDPKHPILSDRQMRGFVKEA